ncbi:MAG TPA: hypothetical protein H9908_08805 [Candidatus Rothia avistercoris]|uniref:Uncharacterized protein n=1 Tax=Candidatus Rothia avistercoris TaxID=2840479 RepID=A0A9D2UGC2_9MICC|nr:hypothetical protein [Candidatus Rothia avistercoris]
MTEDVKHLVKIHTKRDGISMSRPIASDDERMHEAAEEMFDVLKGFLPEILLKEIPVLLFVGEEGIAIDFMAPYYDSSNVKLSQSALETIEELHELKL